MLHIINMFLHDEEGTTAIQYGMLAAMVAIIAIAALTQMTNEIKNTFSHIETQVESATTSAS